jgi:hypothetical protein
MDQPLQMLALVAAFTTAVVGATKKAFPNWADGKEELLALVIPIIIVPVLKLTGVVDLTWANAVVMILFGGAGAGVLHDKFVNPLLAGKKQPSEVKPS